jgi:hypothetical protein
MPLTMVLKTIPKMTNTTLISMDLEVMKTLGSHHRRLAYR